MKTMVTDEDDTSSPPQSPRPPPPRSRSVMDYYAMSSLRRAMQENCLANANGSCSDWQLDNLDASTSVSQNLEEEMARLEVLKSYHILDQDREQSFERITGLASRIFDVPIALVSLVDLGRQWFMSNRGLGDARETPRNVAFCAHAILSTQDLFIVNDASLDPRFKDNALVTGAPHIRFYAGAPLICPEGYKLGTLCIIDLKPRPNGLSLFEKQNLRELADMVIDNMLARKKEREKVTEDSDHAIACTAHDLLTPLTGIQLNLGLLLEDGNSGSGLDQNSQELVQTAVSCSEVMSRICYQMIESFRSDVSDDRRSRIQQLQKYEEQITDEEGVELASEQLGEMEEGAVVVSRLIENLQRVVDPYPKKVPITIDVDEDVPPVIMSDDLKIFRSALNFITNACDKTESGVINFRVFVQRDSQSANQDMGEGAPSHNLRVAAKHSLVFECTDTGPGIDVESYPNLFMPIGFVNDNLNKDQDRLGADHSQMGHSGLGLFSVASNISSLDGDYGFHPREEDFLLVHESPGHRKDDSGGAISCFEDVEVTGSVFWFSVPIFLPVGASLSASSAASSGLSNISVSQMLPEDGEGSHDFRNETKKNGVGAGTTNSQEEMRQKLATPSKKRPLHPPSADEPPLKSTPRILERNADLGVGTTTERDTKAPSSAEVDSRSAKEAPPETFASAIIPADGDIIDSKGGPSKRAKRAMVIDDSLTIRKGVDRALTRLGFEVTQAENGMEGLKHMKLGLFDLVLCDFLMPVMDGLDCVQQFRAWESEHRSWFRQYIVGISAHASSNDAKRGIDSGMDKFLPKPVPLNKLKELSLGAEVLEASKQLDERFLKTRESEEREEKELAEFMNTSKVPVRDDESSIGSLAPVCLIAEDSISVAKALKRCVEKRGWRASLVQNGEDALRLLKMRNWDAVLLDDQMPKLSGTSCVSQFREWEAKNRVARQDNIHLVSGFYVPKERSMLPSGFDGAMGKPVKMKVLMQLLDSISCKRGKQSIL